MPAAAGVDHDGDRLPTTIRPPPGPDAAHLEGQFLDLALGPGVRSSLSEDMKANSRAPSGADRESAPRTPASPQTTLLA